MTLTAPSPARDCCCCCCSCCGRGECELGAPSPLAATVSVPAFTSVTQAWEEGCAPPSIMLTNESAGQTTRRVQAQGTTIHFLATAVRFPTTTQSGCDFQTRPVRLRGRPRRRHPDPDGGGGTTANELRAAFTTTPSHANLRSRNANTWQQRKGRQPVRGQPQGDGNGTWHAFHVAVARWSAKQLVHRDPTPPPALPGSRHGARTTTLTIPEIGGCPAPVRREWTGG